jgi:hypothetical protein
MKRLLAKHKTTVVGTIAGLMVLAGFVRWMNGDIDATEFGSMSGIIGGVAATIIGLLSKDGKINPPAK